MAVEDTARINGDIIMAVRRLLDKGTLGIDGAKSYLKMLMQPIEKDGAMIYRWQFYRMVESSGVTILDATKNPPKTFREFIEAPPLRGLGERLEDIERLIADDDEAVVMLRKLTTPAKGGADKNPKGLGGKSQKIDNAYNISIVKNELHSTGDLFPPEKAKKQKANAGNSRAYTLTRLKKERPDLFERVCAKELSANAAAIKAGWRKTETTLDALKRHWRKASAEERQQFMDWVESGD